ncbi:hypothetical protein ACJIZ3_012340 [Penstemon smallii]|uniref:Uncharacterized protein n=1 Tax=Penstemon smallii TaxID=265156 RepID=A0ABD3UR16_9LAMI
MLKRAFSISLFPNSSVVLGLRRRKRRRKGGAIRLGNRRRGFCIGFRRVVHWGVMACPFRVLKKIIIEMVANGNGRLVEAYCWSLPFLRPQIFPLC